MYIIYKRETSECMCCDNLLDEFLYIYIYIYSYAMNVNL